MSEQASTEQQWIEKPSPEHQWLHKLLGQWTIESECTTGPDQPPMKTKGIESVRSLGGLWTIGEGTMGPEGETGYSVMTLGYDPRGKHFVGSFIASMMTHFWPYKGSLDADGKVLTLDSEGPSFAGDGTMSKYQDIIEFIDDDHRVLSSRVLQPDGTWIPFMTAHYRRVPADSGSA